MVEQIVSRNMTNLTPAQLEQFEGTFRYFDRDETNTLELAEMTAALASLGIIHPASYRDSSASVVCSYALQDEDMHLIHEQLAVEYGAVTYEAFINLLVRLALFGVKSTPDSQHTQADITEGQTTLRVVPWASSRQGEQPSWSR